MPEGGTVVDGPAAAKKASTKQVAKKAAAKKAGKSGGTVTIQSTPWGACGAFTDPDKIVTTYPRKGGTVNGKAIPAGTVDMRCGGPKLNDNPTWGYRHLIAKHKSEWQNRAAVAGNNFIDFTDWAIGIVLSDPDSRVYQAGPDNFCYSRTIYLVDKRSGRTVGTAVPRVAFNRKYSDIITTFPPSTNTCTA